MKDKPHIPPPENDDPFLLDAQEGWNQFPRAGRKFRKMRHSFRFFLIGQSWTALSAGTRLATGAIASVALISVAAVTLTPLFKSNQQQPVIVENMPSNQKEDIAEGTKDIENESIVRTEEHYSNTTSDKETDDFRKDINGEDHQNMPIAGRSENASIAETDQEIASMDKIETLSGNSVPEKAEDEDMNALPFVWIDQYRVLDYDRITTVLPSVAKKEAPTSLNTRFSNHSEEKALEESVVYDTVSYREFISDAISKMKQNRYDEAEYEFKKLQVQYPDDENALFYLGYCAFYQGKYPVALSYFEKSMNARFRAFAADAEWYKAKSYLLNGDRNKARTLLKAIARRNGFYAKEATKLLETEFND